MNYFSIKYTFKDKDKELDRVYEELSECSFLHGRKSFENGILCFKNNIEKISPEQFSIRNVNYLDFNEADDIEDFIKKVKLEIIKTKLRQ